MPPGTGTPCVQTASLAPARVWRLTDEQYVNVARDVLGITLTGADAEISTTANNSGTYTNMSEGNVVNIGGAQNYQTAAQKVATQAVAKIATLVGSATPTAAQVEQFVTSKVSRLWRRPVVPDEVAALTKIYNDAQPDGVSRQFGLLVQAALQAPSFLYRTELGTNAATSMGSIKMTPHEIASALSFFFVETAPDDDLWSKAESAAINDPAVLALEVNRLLALPATRANLARKASYWLGVEVIPTDVTNKSPTIFPEFTETLKTSLYQATFAFVEDILWNGKVSDLFTSQRIYANQEIGKVYGITGATGNAVVPLTAATPERSYGILTQPGMLLANAHRPGVTDPIHRGLFVYNTLLCGLSIPPAPPDALDIAATMSGTERELVDQRAKISCGACHANFDPLGLTFERYDSIGRYNETKYVVRNPMTSTLSWATSPTPIDTSAVLPLALGPDMAGPVSGVAELAAKLKANPARVSDCAAGYIAQYSLGYDPNAQNSCAIQAVKQAFAQSGSFIDFFKALTTSPAFVARDIAVK
jgi:Protein of unknown function (DUF1592)/Protein of unknown function (DUF1588)/Protein of unknown function (DUF1595)/Protein of unknown function (DUF1585)/Protein of unknown function (DUF1587)